MFSPQQGADASNALFGNPLGAFGAIGVQIAGWIKGKKSSNTGANASAQSQAILDAVNAEGSRNQQDSQVGTLVIYGIGALIIIVLMVWLVRIAVKG
jgi:predicted nucleic acid-binding Zn ribbon protein